MSLILYSKPGCHLCEGLAAKLAEIENLQLDLEIRDITTQPDWWERYQYEIPVLCLKQGTLEQPLPRFSPRTSVTKITDMLIKYSQNP
ncbi:MAG: glutaredoxin family protein [Gloeocapsa sp. DLM2.Bin57]|nr:MAG: glutaredoxin family protein [Gloeocapsa sp. DLM2.Bin57]